MATIECPGGHIFSDNLDPNPNKYHVMTAAQRLRLAEQIIEACKNDDDIELAIHELTLEVGVVMYKCPHCGRFLLVDEAQSKLISYVKET